MAERKPVGLGIIGAGRFAAFCLPAFAALPEVRVVAVADLDRTRAESIAPPGARIYQDFRALLMDSEVEVVVISTPPYLHAPIALEAAKAGKHLFVEKPLALSPMEARAVIATAERMGVKLTVNYVLRYHPLHRLAQMLVRSKVLGDLVYAALINLATDEGLSPDHWFWDLRKSGGIHIEHGVHFFDLVNQLVGRPPSRVEGGYQRRADGRIDRVWAVVHYGEEVLATFYHSFGRPREIERTTLKLGLSFGEIEIVGWIPTKLSLFGGVEEDKLDGLRLIVGEPLRVLDGANRKIVEAEIAAPDRQGEYRRAVQAGLLDLIEAVWEDRSPQVSPADALQSLEVAWQASQSFLPL
ncbi:MAG: Gfo/Idh/MocA family protein [Candidatus Bipolaricaulaceae bacterium]